MHPLHQQKSCFYRPNIILSISLALGSVVAQSLVNRNLLVVGTIPSGADAIAGHLFIGLH
jgi:hypothetical protein